MKEINIRCRRCDGHGIEKQEEEICKICNGIKCIMCNERGYKKMPYTECNKCYGSGKEVIQNCYNL